MAANYTIETLNRIEEINDDVVKGTKTGEIVAKYGPKWGIGTHGVKRVVGLVRKQWERQRGEMLNKVLAKAMAVKEMMWKESWKAGDRATARLAHRDLCELQGILPDQREKATINATGNVQIVFQVANGETPAVESKPPSQKPKPTPQPRPRVLRYSS